MSGSESWIRYIGQGIDGCWGVVMDSEWIVSGWMVEWGNETGHGVVR